MPRFDERFLDELKGRLSVSQVVGQKAALKKAGRSFKACCPFHSEKTPSFFIDDAKRRWYCFGSCKEGGDIIAFIMKADGLSFPEAVEHLAGQAGLELPPEDGQRDPERGERRKRVFACTEEACRFYETQLRQSQVAIDYLKSRGMTGETAKAFRVGFAPDSPRATRQHLSVAGFSREAMVDAGMIVIPEGETTPIDRFRGRIMFPVIDVQGRVLGFSGRALDPDVPAKYLNTPATEVFDKGRTLFNLGRGSKAIHKAGQAIIVEGNMDVVMSDQSGTPNVVAPLGTALTEDQLLLLWQRTEHITVCFDGDDAGQKAASRALDIALPHLSAVRRLRIATMPPARDPDELIRTGQAEEYRRILGQADAAIDFLWRREQASADTVTPEGKAALDTRIAELVGQIRDQKARDHYAAELRARAAGATSARPMFQMPRGKPDQRQIRSTAAGRPATAPREAAIILGALAYPGYADADAEAFAALSLRSADADRVRRALLEALAMQSDDPRADVLALHGEDVLALESALPAPRPAFVDADRFDEWKAAVDLVRPRPTS